MTPTPVEFDPFSETYFNDPTDVYRRLRDEAPVYYSERYDFFALSRFADVLAAHRDWQTFSSARGIELGTLSKDPEMIRLARVIIMMDPPEHDRLRSLVSRVFTPRAVSALEPMVREVISGILHEVEDLDQFDAVADFAALFPIEVISRMLGVPSDDRQKLREWHDVSLHREPGDVDPTPEGQEAILHMAGYFFDLAADKRRNPSDDMISRLTQVSVERDDGAETVTKLVGNAVVLFADHPQAWAKVQADANSIPRALEEILRFLPPSQYQGRFSLADAKFEGGTIPAGHPVLLLTGAATRDPRAFEDPDRFDIERQPGISIGFGHGVHSCLGAALARLESRIAIEELAKRWLRLEVDKDGLRRVQMANVAGYANVPVRAVR